MMPEFRHCLTQQRPRTVKSIPQSISGIPAGIKKMNELKSITIRHCQKLVHVKSKLCSLGVPLKNEHGHKGKLY